jgi:hypothetical protein
MPEEILNQQTTTTGGESTAASTGAEQKPASGLAAVMEQSAKVPEPTAEQKAADEKAKADKATADAAAVAAQSQQTTPEDEVKKWQSRYDKDMAQLKKELETSQNRIKDYDDNPIVALKKYHPQVLENLEAVADPDAFLGKWQGTTLIQEMKTKFPDKVTDNWTFDPSEAYTAGTPSYFYRIATDEKRSNIINSQKTSKEQEAQVLQTYAKQVDEDSKWLKTQYSWDDAAWQTRIAQVDTIHKDILAGKLTPDKHPLSLRNVMRGVFFDELVKAHEQRAAESAVSALKEEYRRKGLVLPENAPTDANKKSETQSVNTQSTKKSRGFAGIMEKAAQ